MCLLCRNERIALKMQKLNKLANNPDYKSKIDHFKNSILTRMKEQGDDETG